MLAVIPVVKVEKGDEVGVSISSFLRHQVNSLYLADALCLELLADEGLDLGLILRLRLSALLAREAAGIATGDVQRHLIIEGSTGSSHDFVRVDFRLLDFRFVWELSYTYTEKSISIF